MAQDLPDDFESMLAYTCLGATPNNDWKGKPGRPHLPLNDMVYSAVVKVIRRESARTLTPYLQAAKARGLLSHVPSHQSLQLFLNRADTRQALIRTILHSSDLLAHTSPAKRFHRKVRFASGIVVFGRSYDTLINEALCLKVAEMTLKCCLYGVDTESPVVLLDDESLLAMLREQVPDSLPKHLRDEIYQEMVVAALNGEMRPDRMRGFVSELLRRVRRFEPSQYTTLLDAPIKHDGPVTFGERIMAHR